MEIGERDGFGLHKIESGTGTVEIACMDPRDYPAYPDDSPDGPVVKCQDLVKVLSGLIVGNTTIPVLFDGDYSRVVSTDGHRMNTQAVDWLPGGRALIMGTDIKRLTSSLSRAVHKNQEVMVAWTEKEAVFRSDGFEARIRHQEHNWVELGFVGNPEDLPACWIEDKQLRKALKLAKIMTKGESVVIAEYNDQHESNTWISKKKSSILTLHFRPFRVTFKTELLDVGSCQHTVECYVPAELCGQEIMVNIRYFEQAAKKVNGNVPIRAVGGFLFVGDELICQMKKDEKPRQEEREREAA